MDDPKSGELMPVIYRHRVVWEVTVGKRVFELNDQQTQILKDMSLAGKSSIVWFGEFAISIPHISSIEKVFDEFQVGKLRLGGNYSFLKIDKKTYEKESQKQIEK